MHKTQHIKVLLNAVFNTEKKTYSNDFWLNNLVVNLSCVTRNSSVIPNI